jgi:hypothetical protein
MRDNPFYNIILSLQCFVIKPYDNSENIRDVTQLQTSDLMARQ